MQPTPSRDEMAKSTILQRVDGMRNLRIKRPTAAYQWTVNQVVDAAIEELLELAASGKFYRDQVNVGSGRSDGSPQ